MKTQREEIVLIQLPVPGLEWRRRTGNIPLAAACLKEAAHDIGASRIRIMPQSTASYLADLPLIRSIEDLAPDLVGFSVYCWNADRSAYMAERLKERLSIKAVAGGPEITPDNKRNALKAFDVLVFGEGEGAFRAMVSGRSKQSVTYKEGEIFKSGRSPYVSGLLEPELEDMVLLETQRGCPHRCAYCYYNTAHRGCVEAPRDSVMECVKWTVGRGISELYLLDPCLDAHPDLKSFLKALAAINPGGPLSITSEIRAESIDDETADLFAACNFKSFEIGLQSTNPVALSLMRRRTDLSRFLCGVDRLRKRGIATRIDLIAGLPGDDLASFKKTVDFVVEHNLHVDIQVFALSLLPGTEFRRRHLELGIKFSKEPPYIVKEVPGFPEQAILEAFSYAEERCGISLSPMPFLDIPYKRAASTSRLDTCQDITDGPYVCRVVISGPRTDASLTDTAARLTFPYQVVFLEGAFEEALAARVLNILTSSNPFTPLEIVLHEPEFEVSGERLASLARLRRPHYMDGDLRYMFPRPGNRAVLTTAVSRKGQRIFSGGMTRQVYWWQSEDLPDRGALDSLMAFDGVLIDPCSDAAEACRKWQDDFHGLCDEFPAISFADVELQKRWLYLTIPGQMCRGDLFVERH